MEALYYLFCFVGAIGWVWSCYYGWQEGIVWFLLMFLCQIGVPIWYTLKLFGDKREFEYLKYPAMLYFGGLAGAIGCQAVLLP
jgi:hypothetical protein